MKLCPFCDSEDLIVGYGSKNEEGYPVYIVCEDCGGCGPVTWMETVPESVTEQLTALTGWDIRPEVKKTLIEKAQRTVDDLIDVFEDFESTGLTIDHWMRFYSPASMKKLLKLIQIKEKM